jgi:hypothetical protein
MLQSGIIVQNFDVTSPRAELETLKSGILAFGSTLDFYG